MARLMLEGRDELVDLLERLETDDPRLLLRSESNRREEGSELARVTTRPSELVLITANGRDTKVNAS